MRVAMTARFVWAISLFIVLMCVVWAILADQVVPTACSYPTPPAGAQYLHCG